MITVYKQGKQHTGKLIAESQNIIRLQIEKNGNKYIKNFDKRRWSVYRVNGADQNLLVYLYTRTTNRIAPFVPITG